MGCDTASGRRPMGRIGPVPGGGGGPGRGTWKTTLKILKRKLTGSARNYRTYAARSHPEAEPIRQSWAGRRGADEGVGAVAPIWLVLSSLPGAGGHGETLQDPPLHRVGH
jgi:hypothetical protein